MNSYSRDTLRNGWHKTANGPYGAPRGNPVMKAKRVTGESAQARLCRQHTVDLAKEREHFASVPVYTTKVTGWKWSKGDDPLDRASVFGH